MRRCEKEGGGAKSEAQQNNRTRTLAFRSRIESTEKLSQTEVPGALAEKQGSHSVEALSLL